MLYVTDQVGSVALTPNTGCGRQGLPLRNRPAQLIDPPNHDTRRAAIASLTAHLRRPDEHGRLAFHPECPLCRSERLAGALPRDAVVGHRTQAVLAAGVLALSTASPAVALAQEPDQQQEGGAVPDPVAAPEAPAEPDFDPGGNATDLPFNATTAPEPVAAVPPVDDEGAAEPEPATDVAPPIADPGDGSGTRAAPVPGVPPVAPASPPEPLSAEPGTDAIAPSQDASEPASTPVVDDDAPAPDDEPAGTRKRPRPVRTVPLTTPGPPPDSAGAEARATDPVPPAPQQQPADAGNGGDTDAPVALPLAATAPAPQSQGEASPAAMTTTTQARSSAGSNRQAAHRGDRSHVVRPGESLWSIASDLLGEDASTARIAREVNRLWELNRSRIATGDPDLLTIGTKLVLR